MDSIEYEAVTDIIAVVSEILLFLAASRTMTSGEESLLQRRLDAAEVMLAETKHR